MNQAFLNQTFRKFTVTCPFAFSFLFQVMCHIMEYRNLTIDTFSLSLLCTFPGARLRAVTLPSVCIPPSQGKCCAHGSHVPHNSVTLFLAFSVTRVTGVTRMLLFPVGLFHFFSFHPCDCLGEKHKTS